VRQRGRRALVGAQKGGPSLSTTTPQRMTQSIYSIATEDLDIGTFDVDSQFDMLPPDMTLSAVQSPDLNDSDDELKIKPLAKAHGNIFHSINFINLDFYFFVCRYGDGAPLYQLALAPNQVSPGVSPQKLCLCEHYSQICLDPRWDTVLLANTIPYHSTLTGRYQRRMATRSYNTPSASASSAYATRTLSVTQCPILRPSLKEGSGSTLSFASSSSKACALKRTPYFHPSSVCALTTLNQPWTTCISLSALLSKPSKLREYPKIILTLSTRFSPPSPMRFQVSAPSSLGLALCPA